MTDLLGQLTEVLGEKGLLRGHDLREHPASIFGAPKALMRPASTEELSAAMKLCHAVGQPVVPQGGRTGLVSGGLAGTDEIIVSLERMNQIEDVNRQSGTMTVQSGVTLQAVQEAAGAAEMMFPLDLGARGSATIGGNISTNAGGNRVVRYGMTRHLVLGLEAVLADGTVISSMSRVIKNNTGYDLKQLFIGSEGTLGIVTRAVLRLQPAPMSRNTALVALGRFEDVIDLLHRADGSLGGSLSSFEVLWNSFYAHVLTHGRDHNPPLPDHHPYYVIIEALGSDQEADDIRFNTAMEALFDSGLALDAVVFQSAKEREAMWAIRDDIESLANLAPHFTFDVSVPLDLMEDYVAEVTEALQQRWPGSRDVIFGHLGDGNLHIVASVGSGDTDTKHAVEDIVYGGLRGRDGVISAEHGIGLDKKSHLDVSRSDEEVALMRTLKQALDPTGILNPGKILDRA